MKKTKLFISYWVRILLAIPVAIVIELFKVLLTLIEAPFSGFAAGVRHSSYMIAEYETRKWQIKRESAAEKGGKVC